MKSNKKIARTIGVVASVFASVQMNSALSQEKNEQQKEIQQVVISNSYDPRKDDTATKIVIRNDEIKKFGDENVLGVLARQPNITVVGNRIMMRGLAGYTQMLVDGQPLTGGLTISNIDVESIEKIEILKVATADLSSQGIAGTINIILKKKNSSAQTNVKFYANHWGPGTDAVNFVLQLSDKFEKFSYTVNIKPYLLSRFRREYNQKISTTNLVLNTTSTIDQTIFEQTNPHGLSLSPRMSWKISDSDTLDVQANVFKIEGKDHGADHSIVFGNNIPIELIEVLNRTTVSLLNNSISADWKHKTNDTDSFNLKLAYSGSNSSTSRKDDFLTSKGSTQTYRLKTVDDSLTLKGSYQKKINDKHTIKSGLDFTLENSNPLSSDLNGSHFSDFSVNRSAFFIQDEWETTSDWSNYLGVRIEKYNLNGKGSGFSKFKTTSSALSPIFQSLWKIPESNGDQIRIAIARTFRNPSFTDLTPNTLRQANNTIAAPDLVGNPNLKPEQAFGVDGGYEHFGANGVTYGVSFYARNLSNVIRRSISFTNQRWIDQSSNVGSAQTKGLEVELKIPMELVMESAKNLTLKLNGSRNWSSVDAIPGPNNLLDEQIRVSSNIGLDYAMSQAVTFGANYTFTSGGDYRLSVMNSTKRSPVRNLDAFFSWKIDKNMNFRVAAKNLLAQKNYTYDQFLDASEYTKSYRTQQSYRSVGVNLEVKY